MRDSIFYVRTHSFSEYSYERKKPHFLLKIKQGGVICMSEGETIQFEEIKADSTVTKLSKSNILSYINITNMALYLIGFLLTRANFLENISPFGISYFAAFYVNHLNPSILGVILGLGILLKYKITSLISFVAFIAIYNTVSIFIKYYNNKTYNLYNLLISFTVVELTPYIFKRFLMYDFFVSLFEIISVLVFYLIFENFINIAKNYKNIKNVTQEQMIGIGIVLCLVVSGLGNINMYGLTLKGIIGVLFVLLIGYKYGPSYGGAAGITIGTILGLLDGGNPFIVGAFGFSGLIAGLFKKVGKVGVILGFICANSILTFYTNGSTEVLIQLKEVLVASTVLFFLPRKLEKKAETFFNKTVTKDDTKCLAAVDSSIAINKLNNYSKAFMELSKTFCEVPYSIDVLDKDDISDFFDTIVQKACTKCKNCPKCWEGNFHNTYKAMFDILEKLEESGYVDKDDIIKTFSVEGCINKELLVTTINNTYEIYKVNMVWRKKTAESRVLVSQQLEGVSKMIANLAKDLSIQEEEDSDIEQKLIKELESINFAVEEVRVITGNDKKEVAIKSKYCCGVGKCRDEIEKIVSHVLRERMVRKNFLCSTGNIKTKCIQKFYSTDNIAVQTGVASLSKFNSKVSGDSYTFMECKDYKYMIGLSDGMGSGKTAEYNSKTAITLLEKLLESGFDKDIAIKLINSILVLKSSNESFATLDLSVVDLLAGYVEFVKVGASSTFIKRGNNIEVISSANLPVGILENVDIELTGKKVVNGDLIIMVTDGILDSREDLIKKEEWITEYLTKFECDEPQSLANIILDKAVKNSGGQALDDMTVLVCKICEKS